MTTNIHPDTGIAYGYISANALDSDLVNELQNGKEPYHEEELKTFLAQERTSHEDAQEEARIAHAERGGDTAFEEEDFDEDAKTQEFNDNWQPDEPIHEGTKDGVKYRTSWLGGALNVWIFESPFVTHQAGRASPCVPNSGILDTLDGDVTAYNVPDDWRRDPDDGEIAKWVGQRHGRHFDSMPEEVRAYWRKLYRIAHGLSDGTQGTSEEGGMRVEFLVLGKGGASHWAVCKANGKLATGVMHETQGLAQTEMYAIWRASLGIPVDADVSMAVQPKGAGNAQVEDAIVKVVQMRDDLIWLLSHGFHVGPRDPALLGVVFGPSMRARAREDAAYMIYDPSDNEEGFLVTGDALGELLHEARVFNEAKKGSS